MKKNLKRLLCLVLGTDTADAASLGLYKNKVGTLSGNAAITRDEMALYTFNTLTKIAQVKYSSTMDTYYVDGVLASITPPTKTGTDAYQSCKVGSTTEVFIDETNETVTVVTIYDCLGIVTDIDEDNSTIEVKYYYDYDATSEAVLYAYDSDVSATGYEEDDYVIVNLCQNSIADVDDAGEATGTYTALAGEYNVESVAPATSLVGTVTAYANSSTTVDGTKYNRSGTCYFEITAIGYDLDAGSYAFYFDSMGNILGSEVYEAASSSLTYLYVSDSAASAYSAIDGAATVKAAVTYTDGTKEIVNLKVTDATKSTAYYSDPVAFINSADGKTYTLTETEDCEITRISTSNATTGSISSKDEGTTPTVSVFTKGTITDGGEVIAIIVDNKN